jgi:2,5-diamino-6-(ribosylamino)-4(3H)-pyrimidinone 5'-phosphate reductase
MKNALPFVYLNLAMTADGKIATANRAISRFGSRRDLEHLHELRAQADAILCGAGTINAEDADLGAGPARFRRRRLAAGLAEHPVRVVASGTGRIDTDARLFRRRLGPVVILVTDRIGCRRKRELEGLADAVRVCGEQEIDFVAALAWLRRDWAVKRLLGEGGGQLNEALIRAGVVRELHLTICPMVVGGAEAPTVADGVGVEQLELGTRCQLERMRRVGEELYVVYSVVPASSSSRAQSQRRSLSRLR